MKRVWLFIWTVLPVVGVSQDIAKQLALHIQKIEGDPQFAHAVIGMYVAETKSKKVIYAKNAEAGLAPASCQKIITSATAFELLGQGYQFKTYVLHNSPVRNGVLQGSLYIKGTGDPTLGSSRWKGTSPDITASKIAGCLKKNNIVLVTGDLFIDDGFYGLESIPKGWVWEDIGNYYGAGVWGLNWLENQYDITFKTGNKENDSTQITATKPVNMRSDYSFTNLVTTGSKGSGDNGYLFSAPFYSNIIAKGTLPQGENAFVISGSVPNPPRLFGAYLFDYLNKNGIAVSGTVHTATEELLRNHKTALPNATVLDSIVSPTLDSINYWFMRKSVNLFGEALVKKIAAENKAAGTTDEGIAAIKSFWAKKGIDRTALNIIDGSGLSPANRVTAKVLADILVYAQQQNWYRSFYNALPLTNNIKMKDGYINGVRSYAGYIKNSQGIEYVFCFIVNNFTGSPATAREKIWKLLDVLK